nr:ribonuclease H-like domain-containing protein [Tanacetum cinerariifolium]
MWHQRLGHPGGEVLRCLVSSNFISCNREKPHVLCHACQLGKHVRLPFVSSGTVISSCFDIIHSDYVMRDEYNILIKNNTWTLVPRPPNVNVIQCMWLFCHEYLADGTLSRYKARLVANESTQLEGVNVDETFIPVVKPGTIRTVLSLPTSRHWPVHKLDVKNEFLHGDLSETVYMHQPSGFWDSTYHDYDTAYFLLYVDDIVLMASSSNLLHRIISSLHKKFAMTDLGSLNYFLGISVTRDSLGMFLSQTKYAVEILERAGMVNCNPSRTHVDTESKLGTTGDVVSDLTLYQSLAGYCIFLGNNLLSWSAKRQPTLSRSSAQAEYRGVANAVAETCWLRNLLRKLHTPLSSATLVYYDNVSAVYLSSNPIQHQRTKHIEIDIHFVRDLVATGQVRVLRVPSRYQFADTKGLPTNLFEEFRFNLSVRCPPAQTAREC